MALENPHHHVVNLYTLNEFRPLSYLHDSAFELH
jgi:hypothetical protein